MLIKGYQPHEHMTTESDQSLGTITLYNLDDFTLGFGGRSFEVGHLSLAAWNSMALAGSLLCLGRLGAWLSARKLIRIHLLHNGQFDDSCMVEIGAMKTTRDSSTSIEANGLRGQKKLGREYRTMKTAAMTKPEFENGSQNSKTKVGIRRSRISAWKASGYLGLMNYPYSVLLERVNRYDSATSSLDLESSGSLSFNGAG
nr:hypothetical protein Iba_chr05cCG12060 [Ipomoea batatas]